PLFTNLNRRQRGKSIKRICVYLRIQLYLISKEYFE
ncbi:hypothetical protein SEEM316_12540, partial [Salmonella enterica subsp. enterica serovar Montevideo str. 316111868]